MPAKKHFDVIIIGGSYAGLAAAMALGRALRKVLVIDSGDPCNKQTPFSHNFLTNDGRPPKEIAQLARHQVSNYPTVSFLEGLAVSAKRNGRDFEVTVEPAEVFVSGKLILATGIRDLMPPIPGFSECWGITVLHCPYCHGYEVREEKTGILANGDAGYELAMMISNWTGDLTLYTNGPSTLTGSQAGKLAAHNISVVESSVRALEHINGAIEHIVFNDGVKTRLKAIYARLPFIQHSAIPVMLGCELTEEGYIKIDAAQRTTVAGVFACGDNTTRMRTVANAVAMGTTSALMLNRELIEEQF